MRIGLLTRDADHPVLAATAALLVADGHQVEYLDPAGPAAAPGAVPPGGVADVYLLKARTPRALAAAARLEALGAPVLNSAAATARCQDRTEMAALARAAGLPFAATRTLPRLAGLVAEGAPAAPLVVKSRYSRRGDLVARADSAADLRALAADWADEPVVVQEFTENSGWDQKLWVIDGRLFAATRRSELAPDGRGPTRPVPVQDLPESWTGAALRTGAVLGLDIYGVDVLDTGDGTPVIVDINAFPGIRGQRGAPEALAALALRAARGEHRPQRPREAVPRHPARQR